MASDKRTTGTGLGCLTLFALPFAAVGIVTAVLQLRSLLAYQDMQSWDAVPATIVHTELKEQRSKGSSSWEVKADYAYEYQGKAYTGHRVSLYPGSDSGSFQRDAYAELTAHRKSGKPFSCYVNPRHTTEAILYRDLRWEMVCFYTVFTLAFGGVGFGMLGAGWLGYRRSRADSVRRTQHPDEPWLWKKEWNGNEVLSSPKRRAHLWFAIATCWNLVSLPVYFVLPVALGKGGWGLMALVFPVVGLLLLVRACVWIWRQSTYGDSVFHLASAPGLIGGQLAGVINTATKIHPEDGFHLALDCIRKTTTGSGKSRHSSEEIVWQDEQVIAHELLDFGAERSSIPVLFTIPYDCRPSEEGTDNSTTWRLEVSAKTPGLDYREHFDVPIFKTAQSDPNFIANNDAIAEYLAPEDPERELQAAGILKTASPTGNGTRFTFPAGRNPGIGTSATVFLLIWTTAIVVMLRLGAPLFFPIVFGIFDLLIIYGTLDAWFYQSQIDVSPHGMTVTGGLFGRGKSRQLAPTDVAQIIFVREKQSASAPYYNVVVKCSDGGQLVAGKNLRGVRLAKAAVQQIEQALDKKST